MGYNYLIFLVLSIAFYFSLLLLGAYLIFWIWMIIDSIGYSRKFGFRTKWFLRLFVLVIPLVGSGVYFFIRKN